MDAPAKEVKIPTDEEMHHHFHDEVNRAMEALWKPLAEVLDGAEIGKGMPSRVAAAVVCHALNMIGMGIAVERGLPEAAVLNLLKMGEQALKNPKGPFASMSQNSDSGESSS